MSGTVGKNRAVGIVGVDGEAPSGPREEAAVMAIEEGSAEHGERLAKEEAENCYARMIHKSLFLANNVIRQTEQPCTVRQFPSRTSSLTAEMEGKLLSTPAVNNSADQTSSIINKSFLEAIRKVINGDPAVAASRTDVAVRGQSTGVHRVVPVRSTPVLLRMIPPGNKIMTKQDSFTMAGSSSSKDSTITGDITSRPVVLDSSQLQRKPTVVNSHVASSLTGASYAETVPVKQKDISPEAREAKEKIIAGYKRIVGNAVAKWCTPLLQRTEVTRDNAVINKPSPSVRSIRFTEEENVGVSRCRPIYSGAHVSKTNYSGQDDVPLLQREDLAIGGVSMSKSVVGSCIRNTADNARPSVPHTTAKCQATMRQPHSVLDVPLLQRTDLAIDGVFPGKTMTDRRKCGNVSDNQLKDAIATKYMACMYPSVPQNGTTLLQNEDQVFAGVFTHRPTTDSSTKITAAGEKTVNVRSRSVANGAANKKCREVLPRLATLVLQQKYKTFSDVLNDKPSIATYSRKIASKDEMDVGIRTASGGPADSQSTLVHNPEHRESTNSLAFKKHSSLSQVTNQVIEKGVISRPVEKVDELREVHSCIGIQKDTYGVHGHCDLSENTNISEENSNSVNYRRKQVQCAACYGADVSKHKCVPAVISSPREDSAIPCKHLYSSVSYVNVPFQKELHTLDRGMSHQADITTSCDKDTAPAVTVVNTARCFSSDLVNSEKFQNTGTENESSVQAATSSDNCRELRDVFATVSNTSTVCKDPQMNKGDAGCSNFQPSTARDSVELESNGQASYIANTYKINDNYSVPLTSVGLWQVKEEIVDDSVTNIPAHAVDSMYVMVGQGSDVQDNVNKHHPAVTVLQREEVSKLLPSQDGCRGTVPEDKSLVNIPVQGTRICPTRSTPSTDHTDMNVKHEAVHPRLVGQSAVDRKSLLQQRTCAVADVAAARLNGSESSAVNINTASACKVHISVRSNLPKSLRHRGPMSLEQQYDVVISPSTCLDETAKVNDTESVSTRIKVEEFPDNHKSAAAVEVLVNDASVPQTADAVPVVDGPSQSSSSRLGREPEGAYVSKTAGPVYHKRRKPVVNLSALTRRQPSEETSEYTPSTSVVCSAAPKYPNKSERFVGGIYADVIRETNVTPEVCEAREENICQRPTVNRIDELKSTKFQTFSEFRAQQLPSQSRARWSNSTSAVAADHSSGGPGTSSVATVKKEMYPAQFTACSEEPLQANVQALSREKVKQRWDDLQLETHTKHRRGFDRTAWLQDGPSKTMQDLIYHNPPSNPMRKTAVEPMIFMDDDEWDVVPDENVDEAMPAPQVVLNDEGQLVIDERSLFLDVEEMARRRAQRGRKRKADDSLAATICSEQPPRPRSRKWKSSETLKFYRALNAVGTDFSMMEMFFLDRTRRELKQKFLREDKAHRELIDRTLQNPGVFTMADMEQELEEEKIEKKKKEEELLEKERVKKERKERKLTEKQQRLWDRRNKQLLYNKVIYKSKRSTCTDYQRMRRKPQATQVPRNPRPVRKAAMKQRRALAASQRRRKGRKKKEPAEDLEQLEMGADLCKLLEESISSEVTSESGVDGQSVLPQAATIPGSLLVLSAPSPTGRIYKVFMVNDGPNFKAPSES